MSIGLYRISVFFYRSLYSFFPIDLSLTYFSGVLVNFLKKRGRTDGLIQWNPVTREKINAHILTASG